MLCSMAVKNPGALLSQGKSSLEGYRGCRNLWISVRVRGFWSPLAIEAAIVEKDEQLLACD